MKMKKFKVEIYEEFMADKPKKEFEIVCDQLGTAHYLVLGFLEKYENEFGKGLYYSLDEVKK